MADLSVPRFVVWTPDFTHMHSGVRALHLLCDRLNRLGYPSAVTARVVDPRLTTPRCDAAALAADPASMDRSVAIYPEVVAGNPLGARNVVRYLLNRPGFWRPEVDIASFGPDDYFLHFADEFRPPGLVSRRLRLPLVDRSVFRPPRWPRRRRGFLVYADRHRPDIGSFPGWVGTPTVISRAAPRTPPELAALYRSSRALIAGERTLAIQEARHCRCPVILLPHAGFDPAPLVAFFGDHGVVVGFDRAGLGAAARSVTGFPAHFASRFARLDADVREFVQDVERHFGLGCGAA